MYKSYFNLRNKFKPSNIILIFLLESPPASRQVGSLTGKYFYDKTGKITEPLYKAMMQAFNISAKYKEDGLKEFCKRGYLLVDATYKPVNNMSNKERDKTILDDYNNLVKDLRGLIKNKYAKIIIVKANVFRVLKDKLLNDGFNVINGDVMIPFPSNGWQNVFRKRLRKVLRK